jgi:serine/threonine protein kinase
MSRTLPLPAGALVGLRYRVAELLGRGGMGVVYRARHLVLDRDVALKIVPPELGGGAATVRFEREARNGARLDHPGCARVLDVGTTPDGHRFLAMELVEGPTLRTRMAEPTRVAEAARLAMAILDALDHAHERGVVHRDVKPENVLLAAGSRPVLIDFGLSWALGDARVTRRGTTVGSPSYLAPERALGQDGDGRADVYAVGVILYEMLAGRRPFAAATPLELAWAQAYRDPPFLGTVAPALPLALAALVHRALVKDPAARPTAAEMRDALAPFAAVEITVKPSEEPERTTEVAIATRSRFRDVVGWLFHGRWRWRPDVG